MDQISHEVVVELIEEYREAFYTIDTNRSGVITPKELERFLKLMNQQPSQEELHDIFETFCRNPESMTFLEFAKLMVTNTRNYD